MSKVEYSFSVESKTIETKPSVEAEASSEPVTCVQWNCQTLGDGSPVTGWQEADPEKQEDIPASEELEPR